jgi:hypothetical protein
MSSVKKYLDLNYPKINIFTVYGTGQASAFTNDVNIAVLQIQQISASLKQYLSYP